MSKDFILTTSRGELLRITAYGIENLNFSACIILVHGFKGFKDWGFGPYVANYFAKNGYFVLTFNFSHNGVGNSLTEFVDLEKFAENTFSLEIEELVELINAYKNGFFGNKFIQKIGLLGHSRGGAISLLASQIQNEINAIAVWSTIAKLDRYSERQKEKWRSNGVFEVFNTRTKQIMKLNLSLLEDIEKNKDGMLNLEKAVTELDRPLMIAHGEQDLAVNIVEAEQLYEWSNKKNTEFYKLPNSGHTFGMKHPFESSNAVFEDLLNKTKFFFNKNLH